MSDRFGKSPESGNFSGEKEHIKAFLENNPKEQKTRNILKSYFSSENDIYQGLKKLREQLPAHQNSPEIQHIHKQIQDIQKNKPLSPSQHEKISMLKRDLNVAFGNKINESFMLSPAQAIHIHKHMQGNFYSYIGKLLRSFKVKKEIIAIQKDTSVQLQAIIKNQQKNEELRYDFHDILADLQKNYLVDSGIGSSLSDGEHKELFNQAWSIFESQHNKHVSSIRRKKLHTYFLEKNSKESK